MKRKPIYNKEENKGYYSQNILYGEINSILKIEGIRDVPQDLINVKGLNAAKLSLLSRYKNI